MSEASPIAIVTGGSRGLGRATVEALARRGVNSIFTFKDDERSAQEVVSAAENAGSKAAALRLDTGDTSQFPAFVDQVRATLLQWRGHRINFLVNNAGISHHALVGETTEEDFDELYRIHFKGVFFLTKALLPIIADGGRIVNLSTGLTRIIYPGSAAYGSMKGAVEVLTKYLAKELGERRIAVNVVAPGAIQTDFSGGMVRDNAEVYRRVSESTALGRPGVPEDIGPMIASLMSEELRWVNAQRIEVSGGMMI